MTIQFCFHAKKAVLVFSVFILFSVTAAAQSQRVALITELSGSVELARSGSTTFDRADWGSPLFDGDRIRTGSASEAVVLFANNNMMTIGAGNTFTVNSGSTTSANSRSVNGSIVSADNDLTLHRGGQGEIEVLGGLRSGSGAEELTPRYPINTKIDTALPDFSWRSMDAFESFRVVVQSSEGVIWSLETDSYSAQYPEDAPTLSPGETYFWRVEAETMLDVVESPLTSFEILSAENESALKEGLASLQDMYEESDRDAAYQFLLGSLYVRHGVLGKAIPAFEWIAKHHQESPSAHRILGNLYAEVGQKDAAIKSLQRAVDLTQEK